MRSNELVFVQADGLQQLEHLDLDSNNIFRMPKFCDNETGHSSKQILRKPFPSVIFQTYIRDTRSIQT
jgi:hypothetical protein